MSKLKSITTGEIANMELQCSELADMANDMVSALRGCYVVDGAAKEAEAAGSILAASRVLAELGAALLMAERMDVQREELARLRANRP